MLLGVPFFAGRAFGWRGSLDVKLCLLNKVERSLPAFSFFRGEALIRNFAVDEGKLDAIASESESERCKHRHSESVTGKEGLGSAGSEDLSPRPRIAHKHWSGTAQRTSGGDGGRTQGFWFTGGALEVAACHEHVEALFSSGVKAWAFLNQEATPWKTLLLDPLTRYNAIAFPDSVSDLRWFLFCLARWPRFWRSSDFFLLRDDLCCLQFLECLQRGLTITSA